MGDIICHYSLYFLSETKPHDMMCTALSTKSIEEQLPWKTLVTFYRRSTGYQGSLNEFISREALTLHTDMKGTDVKHLYPGAEVTQNIILSNRNFQIN